MFYSLLLLFFLVYLSSYSFHFVSFRFAFCFTSLSVRLLYFIWALFVLIFSIRSSYLHLFSWFKYKGSIEISQCSVFIFPLWFYLKCTHCKSNEIEDELKCIVSQMMLFSQNGTLCKSTTIQTTRHILAPKG